jgi:6-phosphogluconolactonase (cycloisomerase 2 family)
MALGGQYLLAVSQGSHKITVWSVDAATGALTISSELTGNFSGLTVDHSGTFAIATTTDGTVNAYQVSASGTLTQTSTVMAASGVTNVVGDTSGKFVYVENSTASQIFGFSFEPSTGTLTSLGGSPFATGAQPIRMATTGSK